VAPPASGAPGPVWSGTGAAAPRPAPAEPEPPAALPSDARSAPAGLASFGWRAGAFAIDLLTIWMMLVVLTVTTSRHVVVGDPDDPAIEAALSRLVVAGWVAQIAYYWIWNAVGWSPGKRLLGMRVVTSSGEPPGIMRGFARTVGTIVSFLALGLGHLWALWDGRKQAWHDKLAGTYVIRLSG
jgi:Mce-associated membrane protein